MYLAFSTNGFQRIGESVSARSGKRLAPRALDRPLNKTITPVSKIEGDGGGGGIGKNISFSNSFRHIIHLDEFILIFIFNGYIS